MLCIVVIAIPTTIHFRIQFQIWPCRWELGSRPRPPGPHGAFFKFNCKTDSSNMSGTSISSLQVSSSVGDASGYDLAVGGLRQVGGSQVSQELDHIRRNGKAPSPSLKSLKIKPGPHPKTEVLGFRALGFSNNTPPIQTKHAGCI